MTVLKMLYSVFHGTTHEMEYDIINLVFYPKKREKSLEGSTSLLRDNQAFLFLSVRADIQLNAVQSNNLKDVMFSMIGIKQFICKESQ